MNKFTIFLSLIIGFASLSASAMNQRNGANNARSERAVKRAQMKNNPLQNRPAERRAQAQQAVVERRHSFVDALRKYKTAIAATTATAATAVTGAVVASTSQVIDCAQVAQAVCGGQVVSQTALQVCSAHIPSALRCFLGYF